MGGEGNDWLLGQKGNDRIDGGAGFDWIHGGEGNDVFVFSKGSDTEYVLDFRIGEDKIELSGFDGVTVADLLATANDNFWCTTLSVGDDHLILNWVQGSDLSADDFILA